MKLTDEQKEQFNQLIQHRDQIVDNLFRIEHILKVYFPEEFDIAYQHWIPQIVTGLYKDERWLPRGRYSMQDCIDHITDNDCGSGVNKYIKK